MTPAPNLAHPPGCWKQGPRPYDKPRTWPYAVIPADEAGKTANVRKPDGLLIFTAPENTAFAKWIAECLNEAFDWGVARLMETDNG